jgi:hypothetical protein
MIRSLPLIVRTAIWPGSSLHYQQVISTPRYEDFDIKYFDKNIWASLGMGFTVENRKTAGEADFSPYLSLGSIDKKWHVANGGDEKVLEQQVAEDNAKKAEMLNSDRTLSGSS